MPTMTVKNSTGERLRVVDRYVTDPELELSYEGSLSRWIPQGETRVVDYTRFVTESVQYQHPQIISVVVAGGGPEEILHHSDFSDGGFFEFMMEPDVERGPRRLVHTFDAGNGVDAGNGEGEMTAFRKIWYIIMRGAAFLS